jgi:YVTN family beta-propeller protein
VVFREGKLILVQVYISGGLAMESLRFKIIILTVTFVVVITSLTNVALAHEGEEGSLPTGEKGIIFVAMGPSNNFAMIDMATEKVMKAVAGQINPHGIAVTPDGKSVYLTSRNPNKDKKTMPDERFPVVVIDTATGDIIADIDVGGESHHAWMNPDGKQVYITVPKSEGVAVIDTQTNTLIKTVSTGYKVNSTATSPDGKSIYALNKGDDTLSVIDRETLTVSETVDVGKGPDHLAVSPDGRYIYLTAAYANEVWAIKTDTLETAATVTVGQGPHGIAVSSDGKYVFAANRGEATFTMFSGGDLKKLFSMQLGKGPGHVMVPPGGSDVYINDEAEFRTYVFDPDKREVIHTIYLWPEPHESAFYIPSK